MTFTSIVTSIVVIINRTCNTSKNSICNIILLYTETYVIEERACIQSAAHEAHHQEPTLKQVTNVAENQH